MDAAKKVTTGLTRLAVSQNPQYSLKVLYGKILRTLQKMPESYAYRKHTTNLVMERARIVETNASVSEIEKRIDCGQIEEVIKQAENELILARKLIEYKAWEPLVQQPPANQWLWPPHH